VGQKPAIANKCFTRIAAKRPVQAHILRKGFGASWTFVVSYWPPPNRAQYSSAAKCQVPPSSSLPDGDITDGDVEYGGSTTITWPMAVELV
jgi:hypothetical protein